MIWNGLMAWNDAFVLGGGSSDSWQEVRQLISACQRLQSKTKTLVIFYAFHWFWYSLMTAEWSQESSIEQYQKRADHLNKSSVERLWAINISPVPHNLSLKNIWLFLAGLMSKWLVWVWIKLNWNAGILKQFKIQLFTTN